MTDKAQGLRLSQQQNRLWYYQQKEAQVLFAQCLVGLCGPIDPSTLVKTLQQIIERHEILRTRFCRVPGMAHALQEVLEELPFSWREEDLTSTADARARIEAADWNEMDLEKGFLQAILFKVASQEHVLAIRIPALCADSRSIFNLFKELQHGYSGKLGELEEPVQYLDYSEWQHEIREEEDAREGLQFWNTLHAKKSPPWRPFWATESGHPFRPSVHTLDITPGHLKLEQVSEAQLLACWAALLSRMGNADSLLVTHLLDGRMGEQFVDTIGPFAIAAPIHVSPLGLVFGQLQKQGQQGLDEVSDYLEYVSWPEQTLTQSAIVLEYLERPPALQSGDLTISLLDHCSQTGPYDLKLTCIRDGRQLWAELGYNSLRYERVWIERLGQIFRAMLAHAEPETKTTEINLLDQELRQLLLSAFNDTAADYPREKGIHQLFASQAKLTPDHEAVFFDGKSLTYARLDARVNQWAAHLRAKGVGTEVAVGLCVERSVEMLIVLLAVLKAGGYYVAMDPAYPSARLAFILADSRVQLLLTTSRSRDHFSNSDVPTIYVDQVEPELPEHAEQDVRFFPEQTAYVIYTSGSTGNPKGVMVTHRSVVNYLSWCRTAYQCQASDGAPTHSSIGFDLTVTSLFAPLISGRTVFLIPEEEGFDGINSLLGKDRNFSPVKMTPSHLKVIGRHWEDKQITGEGYLVLGGEALSPQDLASWQEIAPKMLVVNEYGPTEATVGCCTFEAREAQARVVPIGTPIANTELYLIDTRMQPLPFGITGELFIGGDGLARGYLNRPGMTAYAFLPNPYSSQPGSRMYRSGDLARFIGGKPVLEYIGRRDSQLKIRGFRVEAGEIEHVLRQYPGVVDAVVLARPDASGSHRLVGYIAAQQQLMVDKIQAFLGLHLPEYMVPAIIVTLDQLPLTANGKVDRDNLPELSSERPDLSKVYVAPRNEIESILVETWKEALGIDLVGVEDNFFALGGDSIRSVRAVAQAQKKGIEISMQQLFLAPTIAALAEQILARSPDETLDKHTSSRAQQAISVPFELVSAEDRAKMPEGIVDAYPISGMQMGMLFHMETRTDSAPVYHNVNIFHLRMHFEHEIFQQAVDEILVRHATMRTSFDVSNYSQPLQLVHNTARLPVSFHDIRQLPKAEQDELLSKFHKNENYNVMDISKAPLLRLCFHLIDQDKLVFTLTEPHSIADGWSQQLLLVELFDIYQDLLEGKAPAPYQAMSVTYRDFIKMEQEALTSPAAKTYWDRILDGASPTRLPRWPSDLKFDVEGHKLYTEIPESIIRGLIQLSRTEGFPLRTIMLASHTKVLSLLSGQPETMSAVSYNGRPEVPGGDKVLGLFLNTLPFRFKSAHGTWIDYVRDVFHQEAALLPHRRYPVSALQSLWGDQPLFEVGFNYIHFHSFKSVTDSGKVASLGAEDLSRTNFPFATSFSRSAVNRDGMCIIFEYDASLFTPAQVATYRDYYLNVLTAMSANPDARHEVSSLLTRAEREQLLLEWNDTQKQHPGPSLLHGLVVAQTMRTPNATAVVFGDESITYRELNLKANQLARFLCKQGITLEDRVVIFMDRSLELAIALLGILKSGAAYVPLDPAYPEERLSYMFDDSQASLALTQQHLASRVSATKAKIFCLDSGWEPIASQSNQELAIEVSPQNVAYVIYTSGSTGMPKGSLVPHAGISNTLQWRKKVFPMDHRDAVLQTTSFAFDASVWELFGPLTAGARLVLSLPMGPEGRPHIPRLVRKHQITAFQLPPSWLNVFLEEKELDSLTSLRFVITGAEPISKDLQTRLFQQLGVPFYNLYGPTEASLDATFWQCDPHDSEAYASIGRPIDNTQIYLLDHHLLPVPIAVAGQMYIAGTGLARGYLTRSGLTAERFLPHPYSDEPGARLYATGDLARYRPDGNLNFMGRVDRQVKIRGARIEPGEIEAVIRRYPDLADAIIHVRTDQPGGKSLVAYAIPNQDVETNTLARSLREFLNKRLPSVLIPSAFVFLERLPLTPNGKIDFKALPAPTLQQDDPENMAPTSDLEKLIAEIWCDVINLEKVGVHSNFFDVGGTSLHIVRIHRKLTETLNVTVTMVDLFTHATIHQLALFLNSTSEEDTLEGPNRTELREASKRRRGQRRRKSRQDQVQSPLEEN